MDFMKNNILLVYQFATFGGVERVILNRAEAFKYYKKNIKLDVYFYEDYGAKDFLKQYIIDNELNDYIEIVDELYLDNYETVITIDTPKIFENKKIKNKNVYIETHTFEKRYRRYLDDYIGKVKKVIVPSLTFYNKLLEEYPTISKDEVAVINNFVPWNIKIPEFEKQINLPNWNNNIVFYYGRMDDNKNTKELVEAIKIYKEKYDNNIMVILIGNENKKYKLDESIKANNLFSNIIFLPPINFNKINYLLSLLKERKAIFVSTSKGETFSLSAAEAIAHDIPVVLSDIEAHTNLVQGNKKFLYELGDNNELAKKINFCFKNYSVLAKEIKKYKKDFSADTFIKEWDSIFQENER